MPQTVPFIPTDATLHAARRVGLLAMQLIEQGMPVKEVDLSQKDKRRTHATIIPFHGTGSQHHPR